MRKTLGLSLVLVSGLILSGCESEPAEDATLELPADTMAAASTISLDDLAGTWDMRAVPETGDTTATVYQLLVTADGATLMLPDRDPIEGQVAVAGDSLVMVAGPFESVRREGVMTTTHTVLRMEGDRLVGTTVATYESTDADDELRLTTEGTRAP